MRIDPTMTQKKETYQVILDIIKNLVCYNAFLVTADVPEIYMQRFWYSVKKVKKSSFYEFDLDDKKCRVDVEIFKKILGEDFQEYGRAIPDTMLTDEIKKSEAYKAFIGYSTGSIPPTKTIGKGSKEKKQAVTPKKKGSIFSDDNKPVSEEEYDESDGDPAN
ncbi:hypothetical protein Tco_0941350 [Tanacetum coccineum]|uniref:Uncharacterized protein n=1 Tax=Tanacetum coccineum TaxID=301880 RepID=A0ABQ5DR33_9ASTR